MPLGSSRYSLDPAITYLNHASIGTIPRLVQEAHANYLRICESNPWLYMWGGAWEEARETVRTRAASILGCDAGEIAINRNTTDGFNILAHGLPLEEGDEVLFSSLNHAGASACWDHHGPAKGLRVRRFEIPFASIPEMTEEEVVARHVDAITPRTRVLVLPHVDNTVGLRTPVRAIADAARARGVQFVLADGAQTAGMLPVDVRALGVDAFCMSPHKWLQAPKGIGLLYVRKALLGELRAQTVTWGQERWKGTSRILEDYGTRDLPAVLALGDALHFQQDFDISRQERRRKSLWQDLRDRVDAEPKLLWRSPRTWTLGAALCAIEVRDASSKEIGARLWARDKIVLRAFSSPTLNTLRVSPNVMNDVEDLDRLVHALTA